MSSAFVNEETAALKNLPGLPDRTVSAARNLVTTRGLAMLDAALARHREALAAAPAAGDGEAIAREERELRYWSARRASAELSEPDPDPETVAFGVVVTVRFDDDREQRYRMYRIVGEDEADPEAGLLAWTSPVARALLGATIGDTRRLPRGEVEVVAIAR
jgi:transcription elongation GreA/GreB family factor